ncbi:MAG: helix-turn-helix domain-containing protein [Rhodovarius sp.]|nr:helix-turn-helix domain-containing protein [Rhodovarius sp.]
MQPKPIRAVSRALAVLAALNRHGSATALQLARASGVPRATVYRVLQTLIEDGYVARSGMGELFRLRLKVRTLSEGFQDEQWISGVAAPVLAALTKRILWPCDVATLEGTRMVIRETTHRTAPLSIDRSMVGTELPLLASATGLAYLAFAPEAERTALLRLLASSDDPADAPAGAPATVGRLLATTRRRGFGARQGGRLWPHTGAIALPIRHGERVIGCVNVVWMARVMSLQEGIARCLPPLREAAAEIEARLAAGEG